MDTQVGLGPVLVLKNFVPLCLCASTPFFTFSQPLPHNSLRHMHTTECHRFPQFSTTKLDIFT